MYFSRAKQKWVHTIVLPDVMQTIIFIFHVAVLSVNDVPAFCSTLARQRSAIFLSKFTHVSATARISYLHSTPFFVLLSSADLISRSLVCEACEIWGGYPTCTESDSTLVLDSGSMCHCFPESNLVSCELVFTLSMSQFWLWTRTNQEDLRQTLHFAAGLC